MKPSDLLVSIESILAEEYGTPDLGNKQDPLEELVFASLSRQTRIEQAVEAYDLLRETYPAWEDVLGAQEAGVAECLRKAHTSDYPAGERAKHLREILTKVQSKIGNLDLSILREKNDEEAYAWLVDLPQVGPKIAHCVMLFSLGRNVLPVDTHVHRILMRLNLVPPYCRLEYASNQIQSHVPKKSAKSLHVNLVTHGRRTCQAPTPKCDKCALEREKLCAYAGYHVLDDS